jgi:hypothetical protein
MRTVSAASVAATDQGIERLPEPVLEALGELAGAAKEGLLALSVGVGLGVLHELREAAVDDADRAGLQMAEHGARAAGTPLIGFYTPDEMLALPATRLQRHPIRCGSVARRALPRQSDRRSSLIQQRGSPGRDHLTDRAQRSTR